MGKGKGKEPFKPRPQAEVEKDMLEAERVQRVAFHEENERLSLLERRGEARRAARQAERPPRREFEELPGGGLFYDDVVPVPAREDDTEGQPIAYDGFDIDWGETLGTKSRRTGR